MIIIKWDDGDRLECIAPSLGDNTDNYVGIVDVQKVQVTSDLCSCNQSFT